MHIGSPTGTLAVIGGGVIGLSVARRAAQAGWSVRVHRSADPGASWVAGGMLAPHSEAGPVKRSCCGIGLASLALWRCDGPDGYLDGLPPEVVTARESLVVAVDRADVADLRTVGDWLAAQGHPVTPTSTARDIEPLLAQGIRHGFLAATELAVDNRAVVSRPGRALRAARRPVGGSGWRPRRGQRRTRRSSPTASTRPRCGRGCRSARSRVRCCGCVGARAVCRCRERVIRARVHGRQVYLVPRADGVVVGATQYEHGRDTAPAVAGVRELLDDACAVVPALGEYELAECAAGLRPMTPDNLPMVGRLDERTLVAAGHGRSGFLLAPWTAERIVAELGPGRSGVDEGGCQR